MIDGTLAARLSTASGPALGNLRAGDGLGLAPGAGGSLTAGPDGADLLLFELGA